MTRVLVVDDERGLRRALGINLQGAGLRGDARGGRASALWRPRRATRPTSSSSTSACPTSTASTVIEGLRGWSEAPILVLSARTGEPDKVVALDAGADDYVTKPFGMDELLARLRAALRRGSDAGRRAGRRDRRTSPSTSPPRRCGTATASSIRLTPTEWHVLEVLVRNEGKLVSQVQLLKEVWGPAYETESNYLRVYMAQLRRKLEPDPAHPRHLITEPGMGYRFVADSS